MRGAVETCTIWHRARDPSTGKDVWERAVYDGITWDSDIIRSVSGNTASLASAFIVLMPASLAPVVAVGDLVAKGDCNVEITGLTPYREADVRNSLLPDVFTVRTVTDCSAAYKMALHIELQGV